MVAEWIELRPLIEACLVIVMIDVVNLVQTEMAGSWCRVKWFCLGYDLPVNASCWPPPSREVPAPLLGHRDTPSLSVTSPRLWTKISVSSGDGRWRPARAVTLYLSVQKAASMWRPATRRGNTSPSRRGRFCVEKKIMFLIFDMLQIVS